MKTIIKRVGTTYLPVSNPAASSIWYQEKLGAIENYRDEDKAILDFANQSFFLVKAAPGEKLGFKDFRGNEQFSMTFEVNGYDQLELLHKTLAENGVNVGEMEDRGHPGHNFVFADPDGNIFDVWSELSPTYKEYFGAK
ncbi:VOC family protein [Caldibacillus lycopersici]|uniref:VOC family protein n=1 Tax=Perspicuibacillus lycopersici TaxID=1325689 RepID=A0AAE3LMX0_9BACI|nr:VOC family protein [Perspicuibacillus lycopersici]MCU9613227.1 VOC family protein [Perspicuibacillus lycopersici]